MRFNFGKIATAAASAAMVGSTVALAAAATFPQPFVSTGGSADYAVVYGASADLPAVEMIEMALEDATTSSGPAPGSGIPAGADWLKFQKGDNTKLNLGDGPSDVFGTVLLDDFEDYGNQDIDEDDRILTDTFEFDADNQEDYEQEFESSPDMTLEFFSDNELDDTGLYEGQDVPLIGFDFDSGDSILNYTLSFIGDAECGTSFGECESETINIMGKEFFILDFTNTSATNHQIDLLDTSQTHSISNDPEVEVITVNVDGNELDFEIDSLDTDSDPESVTFSVNGQLQDEIEEDDTGELDDINIDDIFVGIKQISGSDGDGSVVFSVGSGKLSLKNGEEIELNGEDLSAVDIGGETNVYDDHLVNAYIDTTGNNWNSLTIEWLSDTNDMFLVPGLDLTMPGFDTVKFTMDEFFTPEEELTTLNPTSDENMDLEVMVKDGSVDVPLFYTNSTDTDAFLGFGEDEEEELVTSHSTQVTFDLNTDEWFVASWREDDESESIVFKFNPDTVDSGDSTGENDTRIVNQADTDEDHTFDRINDEKDFGEITLTLINHDDDAETATLNITASGGTADYIGFDRLYTDAGLEMFLPVDCEAAANCDARNDINLSRSNVTNRVDSFDLEFVEEDGSDNIGDGVNFNATIGFVGTNDPKVSVTGTSEDLLEESAASDDTIGYVVSDLSTFLHILDTDEEDTLEITYFGAETNGELFLTSAGSGSDDVESGAMRIMDTDTLPSRPLVVVGGTCVNDVAADLLDVTPPTCGDDWTDATNVAADQYLIQSFTRGGNVATLVAGWETADTANAATFLTNEEVTTDAGVKYIGTTETDASVV